MLVSQLKTIKSAAILLRVTTEENGNEPDDLPATYRFDKVRPLARKGKIIHNHSFRFGKSIFI